MRVGRRPEPVTCASGGRTGRVGEHGAIHRALLFDLFGDSKIAGRLFMVPGRLTMIAPGSSAHFLMRERAQGGYG